MNWAHIFSQTARKSPQDAKLTLEKIGFKKTFKIFNVIGTNGKGSTSAFLAQGFQSQGLKVGLFTSPHLIHPNERITINGKEITDQEFDEIYQHIKDEPMNFFAYTYIVAMMHFMNQKCDVVILEAGIGGSLDTTNAIDGDWGCITNVSLDHTELLGDTIEKITEDKIGIYNDGMIFYYPSFLEESLKRIIRDKITSAIEINNEGQTYKERNQRFAKNILEQNNIHYDGFIFPDGRTQIFKQNGFNVIVDVAHNYDGIKNSLNEIKKQGITFDQAVITMKRSKDSNGVISLINSKELFVFQKDEHFYSANELGGIDLKNPREFFNNINKNTLFIGSFHLAGKVLDEKNKQN